MITVSELVNVLMDEVQKDISILNCGVQIDDRNFKVRFIRPQKKEEPEKENMAAGQPGAYEHWKEVEGIV